MQLQINDSIEKKNCHDFVLNKMKRN